MATRVVPIAGRIDEFEDIHTPEDLKLMLDDLYGDDEEELQKAYANYMPMFEPLNLKSGTYMVTGIEGKYFDGFEPGKRLVGIFGPGTCTSVPDPTNDTPWPMEIKVSMSAIDIMRAAAQSEANGYPEVHHVYFEELVIDEEAMTINFNMGS